MVRIKDCAARPGVPKILYDTPALAYLRQPLAVSDIADSPRRRTDYVKLKVGIPR